MRIKPFETRKPASRPPRADIFLAPEQKLDEEIEFDPRRDVRETDVEGMLDWISDFRESGFHEGVLKLASDFVVVFPERTGELALTDQVWADLEQYCRTQHDDEAEQDAYWKWMKWALFAYPLVTLFPHRRNELDLGENERHEVMSMIRVAQQGDLWDELGKMAIAWAGLFSQERTELVLDDAVWDGMRGRLDETRNQDWISFGRLAATLTLLFPQRRAELDIDGAAWRGMREALQEQRRIKQWLMFGAHVWSLAILAAQDAHITSDGHIEIIPKKPKLASEPVPLPNRPR